MEYLIKGFTAQSFIDFSQNPPAATWNKLEEMGRKKGWSTALMKMYKEEIKNIIKAAKEKKDLKNSVCNHKKY